MGWWHEPVTNGDLVLGVGVLWLLYAVKDFMIWFVKGWRKSGNGKSVLQEARERAARNRQ